MVNSTSMWYVHICLASYTVLNVLHIASNLILKQETGITPTSRWGNWKINLLKQEHTANK